MTPRTFVVPLLTALVAVLTLASSAWAECAWVLWDTQETSYLSFKTAEGKIPGGGPSTRGDQGESFTIIGAYSTRTDCETAETHKIDRLVEQRRKEEADEPPTFVVGKGGGGKYTIKYTPDSNIISKSYDRVDELTFHSYERHWYRCLPDTVDPRGPKGK